MFCLVHSALFCFIYIYIYIYIHVFHIFHQQCITSCITLLSGTLSSVSYRTTLLGVISHYMDNLINTALWPRPYVAPATLFSVMTAHRHGKETGTGQDTSIFRMRTQDRHTQTWLDLATTLPYATQTSSSPIKAQHGELLDRTSTRQEAWQKRVKNVMQFYMNLDHATSASSTMFNWLCAMRCKMIENDSKWNDTCSVLTAVLTYSPRSLLRPAQTRDDPRHRWPLITIKPTLFFLLFFACANLNKRKGSLNASQDVTNIHLSGKAH